MLKICTVWTSRNKKSNRLCSNYWS